MFRFAHEKRWQVCVDDVTPVNGADVRMLRALLAAEGRFVKTAQAEGLANAGSGRNIAKRSNFDVVSFLEEWHVAEEREQGLWWSFQAVADVHMNTALPYDLNALKVRNGAGLLGCFRVVYPLAVVREIQPRPHLHPRYGAEPPSITVGFGTELSDQTHIPWISQGKGNACGGNVSNQVTLSIISFRLNRFIRISFSVSSPGMLATTGISRPLPPAPLHGLPEIAPSKTTLL